MENLGNHIVAKFGGSSVKDAEAIKRCAAIVAANSDIKIVVVSATQHTTNHLEELCLIASHGNIETLNFLFQKIWERHKSIALDLGVFDLTLSHLAKLETELWNILNSIAQKKHFSDGELDHIYSFGERISSAIFSFYLQKIIEKKEIELISSSDLIKTSSDFRRAIPLTQEIKTMCGQFLLPKLKKGNVIFVTQGFLGKDLNGHWTTLGREGSDYSAALLGEGTLSHSIQIWTDVPGISTADPRVIASAKIMTEMSYKEATLLARLGAKVLFPETLLPAERKNIPVFVGSSLSPESGGTWISTNVDHAWPLVGVALMDEMTFYSLTFVPFKKEKIDWSILSPLFLTFNENVATFYLPKRRTLTPELLSKLKVYGEISMLANQTVVSFVGKMARNKQFIEGLYLRLSSQFAVGHDPIIVDSSDFSLSLILPEVDSGELLRVSHEFLLETNFKK